MKRLTGALLILGIFAPAALAQSAKQVTKHRHSVLYGWLRTVRAAEKKYKIKYGVYGDFTALRDAQMLDALIFESDEPTPTKNLVPKGTIFEVTAPSGGQHYRVRICKGSEESRLCVVASDRSKGFSVGQER